MSIALKTRIVKKKPNLISFEIERDNFEAFCNVAGLFRPEFINSLEMSEADYKAGKIKERKSLHELIK